MAQPPTRPGTLHNIKHVVLPMQENRSFDHYFDTLAGVRGFDAGKAAAPQLPDAGQALQRARYEVANLPPPTVPDTTQLAPVQEAGIRKHIPLPK